jgi:tetratricopeptide (TPR) repeat protein
MSIWLGAAGCVTTLYDEPKTLERPPMSNAQAQQTLAACLQQIGNKSLSYQELCQQAPQLTRIWAWESLANGPGMSEGVQWCDPSHRLAYAFVPTATCAKDFGQALYALKYWGSPQGRAEMEAEDAEFKTRAQAWQALTPKPPQPEQARRFQVLANDACQRKDFALAASYYEQALQIAPLWPEGYFNAALLYGEAGYYAQAAWHMDRYLALCPDAADARAARDKMYVWEEKAKAPPVAALPAGAGLPPNASRMSPAERQGYLLGQAYGSTVQPPADGDPGAAQQQGYQMGQSVGSAMFKAPNDAGNTPQQPCFIATAAYGTPGEAHVLTLRRFRDRFLITTAPGRWLVGQYYHYSPPLADMIRYRPWARLGVRTMLLPVVVMAGAALGTPVDIVLLVSCVVCLCLIWRWHRRIFRRSRSPVSA